MAIQTQGPGFRSEIPAGGNHQSDACTTCSFVNCANPKIAAGSIARHEGMIMRRRCAIEYWTLPAGFMEVGETTEQAAMRDAREEANAAIVIDRLLAVYTIPRIAQVQIMYLAHLGAPSFSPGPESLEVMMVGWDEIPCDEIAFPSVTWALEQYRTIEGVAEFAPFSNPPETSSPASAREEGAPAKLG